MNNPLKYTHPSGWLKYYNIDGDWRETSYTTWYGVDWEGPGRGIGGGWKSHTGWTSTTYTLFSNNSQQAGLNGYIGGETVPGDYLGSVTFLQPYTYNVDGFYFPNPTDDKFWYKIPGTYHLVLTYDLKTDKTIGTLIHGDEGLTYGILPREGPGNKHESHKYNPFLKN